MTENERAERAADIASARQLLRSLQNPKALRKNHLVARFFSPSGELARESSDRIQAIIFAAVRSLNSISYKILIRYDIGHESRRTVARDLGVRSSKFYYERAEALWRLAQALKRHQRAALERSSELLANFLLEHDAAGALQQTGRSDIAIPLLQKLRQDAPSAMLEITVLCSLADALCGVARTEDAAQALNAARILVTNARLDVHDSLLASARVDNATGMYFWQTGKAKEALETGERAIRTLHALGDSSREEPAQLLVSILTWLGIFQSNAGLLETASGTFTEALHILNLYQKRAVPQRATLLADFAYVQAITPGKLRQACKTNAEASRLANDNGLLSTVAQCHSNASQFQYWRGELKVALMHSRVANAIATAVCEPVERSRIAVLHARFEALSGAGRTALARVRAARKAVPPNSYNRILSEVVESQIQTRLGLPSAALQAALAAAKRADRIASERGRGLAGLVAAEAYESLGKLSEAIEVITQSIPALQNSGALYPLAQAYLCSARLTSNASHRNLAIDLLATLRQ